MIHLQCVHCNRLPLPSDRRGQHLKRSHTVATISCRVCAQLFVYQSDADKHLMTHCSRECPMCAQKMSVRLINFIFINFTIILIIITVIVIISWWFLSTSSSHLSLTSWISSSSKSSQVLCQTYSKVGKTPWQLDWQVHCFLVWELPHTKVFWNATNVATIADI